MFLAMWFLVAITLAAEPAPPPPAPPPSAPAPPVPAAVPLRACAEGQRCGDRCIPWTEICADAVRESVATMEREAHQALLSAQVCGPAPAQPLPKPPTVESQILLSTAAGILCGASGQLGDCVAEPDPHAVPPPVGTPPGPTCQQSPVAPGK